MIPEKRLIKLINKEGILWIREKKDITISFKSIRQAKSFCFCLNDIKESNRKAS